MTLAIRINITNSLEINLTILLIEAPNVFLTAISFVLLSAINEINPKSPKQAMTTAIIVNIADTLLKVFSLL